MPEDQLLLTDLSSKHDLNADCDGNSSKQISKIWNYCIFERRREKLPVKLYFEFAAVNCPGHSPQMYFSFLDHAGLKIRHRSNIQAASKAPSHLLISRVILNGFQYFFSFLLAIRYTSSKAGWQAATRGDVSREEVLSISSSLPHRQHDRNVTNNDSRGAPIGAQISAKCFWKFCAGLPQAQESKPLQLSWIRGGGGGEGGEGREGRVYMRWDSLCRKYS